jgi:DNA-binding MarR family transcriptional regulator
MAGSPPPRIVTGLTLMRHSAQLMVDELVDRLHAAGYIDITASHQAVFENIDRQGTRLTTLARRSQMTHQSMGELVHTLERAGYVTRQPDPTDGRARTVSLTAKGRRLVRQAVHEIAHIEARWHSLFQAAGYDIDLKALLAPTVQTITTESSASARTTAAATRSNTRRRPRTGPA